MVKDHRALEKTLKAVMEVSSQQEVTARLSLSRASLSAPATVARDISNLSACLTKSMSTMQRAVVNFLEKPTIRRWIAGEQDEVAEIADAIGRKGLTASQVRRILAATLEAGAVDEAEEALEDTEWQVVGN